MTKRIKITYLMILTIMYLNVNAQVTEQWAKTYNLTGSSSGDVSYGIATDNSGNSYVTGSVVNGTQQIDYATIKYNAVGAQEWVRTYNGSSSTSDYASDITVDTEGNIYVTGSVNAATSVTTIKYNPAGDSLWVRIFPNAMCTKIISDKHNNIYVSGRWGDVSFSNYLVIKYNSAGTELWSRKYSSPGSLPDEAIGLNIDNSGNVYLTGRVYVGPFNGIGTVKYDSNGVQKWDAIYYCPDFGSDVGNSVEADNLGNVYITGSSDSSTTGKDIITIKYDSLGVRQWVNRFHDGVEEGLTIRVFDENNIYVSGPSHTSTRPDDFTTLKYNSAGDLIWLRMYNGNNGADRPFNMILDSTGNIYITGQSQLTGSWEDVSTIKYDPSGALRWSTSYTSPGNNPDTGLDLALNNSGDLFVTGRTYPVGNVQSFVTIKYSQTTGIHQIYGIIPENYNLSQNYPNPFNPSTKIDFQIPENGNVNISLYDISGREIAVLINEVKSAGHYNIQFNGSNLSSGIYFYKISVNDFFATKKMTLIK